MKFRIIVDTVRCKGCVLCVSVCPKGVLAMSTSINPKGHHTAEVVDGTACIGCLQCTTICPDAAIEIEQEDD